MKRGKMLTLFSLKREIKSKFVLFYQSFILAITVYTPTGDITFYEVAVIDDSIIWTFKMICKSSTIDQHWISIFSITPSNDWKRGTNVIYDEYH